MRTQRVEQGIAPEDTHEPVPFGDALLEQIERPLHLTQPEMDEPSVERCDVPSHGEFIESREEAARVGLTAQP